MTQPKPVLNIRNLGKATRDPLRKICSRIGIPREHSMSLKVTELRQAVDCFPEQDL